MNRTAWMRSILGVLCAVWTGWHAARASDPHVGLEGLSDSPRRARFLIDRGVWAEAVDVLHRHLEKHPDDDAARFDRAHTLFRLQRFDEAVDEALAVSPKNPLLDSRRRDLLLRLRLHGALIVDWEKPGDILRFARMCARMERYERSIQAYQRLLRDHDDPLYRREYADVLSWSGRFADSAREWERVIAARPNDSEARHRLGRVLMAQGRLDAAEKMLDSTLRLQPNDLATEMDRVRVVIWKDDLDRANRFLRRVIAAHPSVVEPRRVLAELWLRENRVEAAYDLLRETVELFPGDPHAVAMLSELEQSRRVEMARLQRLLDEDASRIAERVRLIELYSQTGRQGAALREMERLARIQTDDEPLRQRIDRLRAQQHHRVRQWIAERHPQGPPEILAAWLARHPNDERAAGLHALRLAATPSSANASER